MAQPTASDLALHLARLFDDKGGADIVVLRLPKSALADFVVIATGRSDRQVNAIVDEALRFCKRHRLAHYPPEGESGWTLIDCLDVVAHAMSEEMRQFYRLDRLWPDAQVVDWQAGLATLPRLEEKSEAVGA